MYYLCINIISEVGVFCYFLDVVPLFSIKIPTMPEFALKYGSSVNMKAAFYYYGIIERTRQRVLVEVEDLAYRMRCPDLKR